MIIEGKTSNGFAFALDSKCADNMEIVDALAEAQDNPLQISKVCLLLLGKDQRQKMYDYLRTEDGRVPIAEVNKALMDIMAAMGSDGKK